MAKQAKKDDPWDVLANLADSLPEGWRDCRRDRHDMHPLAAGINGKTRWARLRCHRGCGVEKEIEIDARGVLTHSRIHYTDPDYQVKGYGHQTAYMMRCALRVSHHEGLMRTLKGPQA